MKNKILSMILLSLATGAMAPTAFADTTVSGGTVHFEGQVVDAACSISADSMDQTVILGQVQASKLATAGSVSGKKTGFNIKLEDCDTSISTNAAVIFNGSQDTALAGVLANTSSSGGALNVGLQLYGPDGAILPVGSESSSTTLIDGSNTLPFSVDYIATQDGATGGNVDATATFNIHYS